MDGVREGDGDAQGDEERNRRGRWTGTERKK